MAHILIVDDEPDIRGILARMLERLGHEIDVAVNGEDALWRIEQREYDLIVTDIRMPRMDGMGLLRSIQPRVASRTPCMIVTAFEDPQYAIEATRLGVCNFLVKPFDLEQISQAVARALEIREAWTYRRRYEAQLESELREILNRFLAQFVDRLESATEARDHCHRVSEWAVLVARQMDSFDERGLPDLEMGALLHDIGKIKIPAAILLKQGPLSPDEWVVMRRHPEYGAEMVQNIPRIANAAVVIQNHHERFDGTGYPNRLQGADIPLPARIFSVVDAFDCMLEKRCYKEPRLPADALEELRRCSGLQFDPDVVAAFESVYPEIEERLRSNGGQVPTNGDVWRNLKVFADQVTERISAEVALETRRAVAGDGHRSPASACRREPATTKAAEAVVALVPRTSRPAGRPHLAFELRRPVEPRPASTER